MKKMIFAALICLSAVSAFAVDWSPDPKMFFDSKQMEMSQRDTAVAERNAKKAGGEAWRLYQEQYKNPNRWKEIDCWLMKPIFHKTPYTGLQPDGRFPDGKFSNAIKMDNEPTFNGKKLGDSFEVFDYGRTVTGVLDGKNPDSGNVYSGRGPTLGPDGEPILKKCKYETRWERGKTPYIMPHGEFGDLQGGELRIVFSDNVKPEKIMEFAEEMRKKTSVAAIYLPGTDRQKPRIVPAFESVKVIEKTIIGKTATDKKMLAWGQEQNFKSPVPLDVMKKLQLGYQLFAVEDERDKRDRGKTAYKFSYERDKAGAHVLVDEQAFKNGDKNMYVKTYIVNLTAPH